MKLLYRAKKQNLQTLIHPKKWTAIAKEVNTKFGTKILEPEYLWRFSSYLQKKIWTPEKDKVLKSCKFTYTDLDETEQWTAIAKDVNAKFNTEFSLLDCFSRSADLEKLEKKTKKKAHALSEDPEEKNTLEKEKEEDIRAVSTEIKTSKNEKWTAEMETFLKKAKNNPKFKSKFIPKKQNWDLIAKSVNSKFRTHFTKMNCSLHYSYLKKTSSKDVTHNPLPKTSSRTLTNVESATKARSISEKEISKTKNVKSATKARSISGKKISKTPNEKVVNKWTREMEKLLVERRDDTTFFKDTTKWVTIADEINTLFETSLTPTACLQRYSLINKDKVKAAKANNTYRRLGSWSDEETNRLLELRKEDTPWDLIASTINKEFDKKVTKGACKLRHYLVTDKLKK